MEFIREVKIIVKIDTNKRTIEKEYEIREESLDSFLEGVNEDLIEIYSKIN